MSPKMSADDAREASNIKLEMRKIAQKMKEQENRRREQDNRRREQDNRRREQDNRRREREEEFKRREIEHQIRMSRLLKASVGLYDFNMCKRDEPILGKRTDSTRATAKSGIEGEIESKNKIGNLRLCDRREGDKHVGEGPDRTEVGDYVDKCSTKVTKNAGVAENFGLAGKSGNFEVIEESVGEPGESSVVVSEGGKHSRAEELIVEKECEEIVDLKWVSECARDISTVDSTRSRVMQGSGDLSGKGLDGSCDVREKIVEPMANEPREIVCSEVEQIVCVGDKQEREPTEELGIESAEEVIRFLETCEESEEIENSRVEERMFESDETGTNVEDGDTVCDDGSESALDGDVIVKGVKVWVTTKAECKTIVGKRKRSNGGFSYRKRKQGRIKSRKARRHEYLTMKPKGRHCEEEFEVGVENFDVKMESQSLYEISGITSLLRNWRYRKKNYVLSELIIAYL